MLSNHRIFKLPPGILLLKIFLYLAGTALLFWWPLSHWFYSEWYHTLLGFKAGSYPDGMVKVIGAAGVMPVLLAFFSARDPVRNRGMIIILITFSIIMAGTYVYLILSNRFPPAEWLNVAICLVTALVLIILFPSKHEPVR